MNGIEILLLSGYRRSGKDTTARYLEEAHGYTQLSIAEPLKDMVAKKYGIPREDLDDQARKELPIISLPVVAQDSPAALMQYMVDTSFRPQGETVQWWTPRGLCILEGTVARAVDPHYWLRQMVRGIQDAGTGRFVVSDVRYASEIDLLKVYFPTCRTVRVIRDVGIPDQRDFSERALDEYPHDDLLHNLGTRGELYESIDRLVAAIDGGGTLATSHSAPLLRVPGM